MTQSEQAPTKAIYVDAIRENSALLAEAAEKGLKAPVPTCPGWFVATLVAHVGEVQRFWAHQIETRAQEPQELPASAYDSCPGLAEWYRAAEEGNPDLEAIPPGLEEWSRAASAELVAAFQAVEPEEQIWHWSGDNRAIVHMRNQAMEATVHRWDAQRSHGTPTAVDPVIALDGIDQHVGVQIAAARRWGKPEEGHGESYLFRADGAAEPWLVRFEGDTFTVRREDGGADLTVEGPAEELFLWLWGRKGPEVLRAQGDTSLLSRYRAFVPSS